MSTFARLFREQSLPGIRRMCKLQGLYVALDVHDFTAAHDLVVEEARRYGSSHLPGELRLDLHDLIDTLIMGAVIEFEAIDAQCSAVADKVAADIARSEAAWAKTQTSLA